MPYFLIQDFSKGLDTRKSAATLPAGSLRYANNVHVTRGGELEKRKAFVPYLHLPPGSVSLTNDGVELVVFSATTQTVPGVQWVNVGGEPSYMLDSTRWSTKAVSSIQMADGTRKVINDTRPITTWAFTGFPLPVAVKTYRGKVYGVSDAYFYGSKLYDPDVWDAAQLGSFFTDTGMQSQFMAKLNAIGVFQSSLVLFSEDGIQMWEVDPDPAKNYLTKSLTNAGCIAPRSVLNFGNFDTVFLSKSGVRSIQARESDAANVNDIGTPVDDLVSQVVSKMTTDQLRRSVTAVVEPEDARLWMSIGDVILVHSYYQGSNIAAWTTYTPGFHIDGMTVLNGKLFVRSGDDIFVYGGTNGVTYDETLAEVTTPYHHAEKPATMKAFTGFDVACEGTWSVWVAANPRNEDLEEFVGKVTDTTFTEPNETVAVYSTHLSLSLQTTQASAVRLASIAMHYTEGVAA